MPKVDLPDPSSFLADLIKIEEQVEADKAAGNEFRAYGRSLGAMSTKLVDIKPILEELGASGDIDAVSVQLGEWAKLCNPMANATWDRETVEAQLKKLEALDTLGLLSDDDKAEVVRLRDTLKVPTGGGQRAPRKPQERIEGRPVKVEILGHDKVVFSTQAGNVPNSAPNLKTAAVAYVKRVTESDEISVEDSKGLLSAAKEVVEGGKKQATYEGITFRAVPDSK